MTLLELIVDAAATTRVTRLVVDDEISRSFRDWVLERTGDDSSLTYLVNCPYCVSVWAGAAVYLAPRWVKVPLALSALAIGARTVNERIEA